MSESSRSMSRRSGLGVVAVASFFVPEEAERRRVDLVFVDGGQVIGGRAVVSYRVGDHPNHRDAAPSCSFFSPTNPRSLPAHGRVDTAAVRVRARDSGHQRGAAGGEALYGCKRLDSLRNANTLRLGASSSA